MQLLERVLAVYRCQPPPFLVVWLLDPDVVAGAGPQQVDIALWRFDLLGRSLDPWPAQSPSLGFGREGMTAIEAERVPGRHRLGTGTGYFVSRAARSKTSSVIGTVSLPVKVFCWLGW